MPTKEDLEMAALDYGVLVSKTREKKLEMQGMEEEVKLLAEKRAMLNAEIAKNEEANERVRNALLDEEKRLDEAKRTKVDQMFNERQILDAQRNENERKIRELNALSDALTKRGDDLQAREKSHAIALANFDAALKKLTKDAVDLEERVRVANVKESALVAEDRRQEQERTELANRLTLATKAEDNAKHFLEAAKKETQAASDDRLKEKGILSDTQHWAKQRQGAERQIRMLLPLFNEARDFVKANSRSPHLIDLYVRQHFTAEPHLSSLSNP